MIFLENHDFSEILKNTIFSTLESEKMLENDFFDPEIIFPKKYATSAPEWSSWKGAAPPSPREFLPDNKDYLKVILNNN